VVSTDYDADIDRLTYARIVGMAPELPALVRKAPKSG